MMLHKLAQLDMLLDEYQTLVAEAGETDGEVNSDQLIQLLAKVSGWTPEAAITLVSLAHDYGSFFLRNAAALAIALNVEDGRRGF